MSKIIEWYLWGINGVTFCLFGLDKYRAKKKKWRIPEALLLGMSAVGGACGGFLGMKLFHHKTRHPRFFVGIPLLVCVHALLIIYFIF